MRKEQQQNIDFVVVIIMLLWFLDMNDKLLFYYINLQKINLKNRVVNWTHGCVCSD